MKESVTITAQYLRAQINKHGLTPKGFWEPFFFFFFFFDLRPTMLAREHWDVSLRALNLVVGMYLQPFESVYNISIYNIGTLLYGKNL